MEPLRYPTLRPKTEGPEEVRIGINKLVEGSLNSVPIQIDAEKSLQNGSEILAGLPGRNYEETLVESNTSREQLALLTRFKGKPVLGMTLPGQKKESGLYPQNMDGLASCLDKDNDSMTLFMTHVDGVDPEGAALSNAAIVTAVYEEERSNAIKPADVKEFDLMGRHFDRANDIAAPVRNEFGLENDRKVEMIMVKTVPDPEHESYRLLVANNGKNHCLIIDPNTGKLESSRQEIPKPGSERAVEKPLTDEFHYVSDAFVVIASDALVEAYGDEEKLAKVIFEKLKDREDLGVFRTLMIDVKKRQSAGEIIDSSVSMWAFKVPKYKPHEFKPGTPPKFET